MAHLGSIPAVQDALAPLGSIPVGIARLSPLAGLPAKNTGPQGATTECSALKESMTMTTITTRINTIDQFATTYAAANATGQLSRIDAERCAQFLRIECSLKSEADMLLNAGGDSLRFAVLQMAGDYLGDLHQALLAIDATAAATVATRRQESRDAYAQELASYVSQLRAAFNRPRSIEQTMLDGMAQCNVDMQHAIDAGKYQLAIQIADGGRMHLDALLDQCNPSHQQWSDSVDLNHIRVGLCDRATEALNCELIDSGVYDIDLCPLCGEERGPDGGCYNLGCYYCDDDKQQGAAVMPGTVPIDQLVALYRIAANQVSDLAEAGRDIIDALDRATPLLNALSARADEASAEQRGQIIQLSVQIQRARELAIKTLEAARDAKAAPAPAPAPTTEAASQHTLRISDADGLLLLCVEAPGGLSGISFMLGAYHPTLGMSILDHLGYSCWAQCSHTTTEQLSDNVFRSTARLTLSNMTQGADRAWRKDPASSKDIVAVLIDRY